MINITCRYTHLDGPCAPPEWVVVYICDKCAEEGTIEVCADHYKFFKNYMNGGIVISCSECRGNLSFVAQKIETGEEQTFVH